jgi:hypothetical protein
LSSFVIVVNFSEVHCRQSLPPARVVGNISLLDFTRSSHSTMVVGDSSTPAPTGYDGKGLDCAVLVNPPVAPNCLQRTKALAASTFHPSYPLARVF